MLDRMAIEQTEELAQAVEMHVSQFSMHWHRGQVRRLAIGHAELALAKAKELVFNLESDLEAAWDDYKGSGNK